jgi:hypothetical protein
LEVRFFVFKHDDEFELVELVAVQFGQPIESFFEFGWGVFGFACHVQVVEDVEFVEVLSEH